MSRKVINIVPQKQRVSYFDFSIPEVEPITSFSNSVYRNIQLSSDFDVNSDCNIAKMSINDTEIELKFIKTFEYKVQEEGVTGGVICYNAFYLDFSGTVFTLKIMYDFTNNIMVNVDFAQTTIFVP